MYKRLLSIAALSIITSSCISDSSAFTASDMDRIADVHYLAELVESFHAKNGHYPLVKAKDGSIGISISDDVSDQNNNKNLNEFIYDLRSVSNGLMVSLDPHKDPYYNHGLYQYYSDGFNYFISAHLHNPTWMTRKLGWNVHKYQVSSTEDPTSLVWEYQNVKDGIYKPRDDEKLSKLYVAIRSQDVDAVRFLLETEDININPLCSFREVCKPIIVAIEEGTTEILNLLIDYGADVDGGGAYKDHPLVYAFGKGNFEAMDILLDRGADVNQPNAFGISPFIGICGYDIKLVKKFVKHGADLNAHYPLSVNSDRPFGPTPLMMAAEHGKFEIAAYLIEKGVDVSVLDDKGRSAKDIAVEQGFEDIANLF